MYILSVTATAMPSEDPPIRRPGVQGVKNNHHDNPFFDPQCFVLSGALIVSQHQQNISFLT